MTVRFTCRWILLAAYCLAFATLGCGSESVEPEPPSSQLAPYVDDSPAWSFDARWIAFHRAFPSTYGPPGVYVIPSAGGQPGLVCRGDFLGPAMLRFSPDGSRLVGVWGQQLVIISVADGSLRFPSYTDNVAADPDWSPDGATIVYARLDLQRFPPEDPESTGIHLYHVDTGIDHALRANGEVIMGFRPRWSKTGDRIAFIGPGPTGIGNTVQAINPSDSSKVVFATSAGEPIGHLQYLNANLLRHDELLFDHEQTPRATFRVPAVGGAVRKWPITLGPWDEISHNGESIVYARPDPSDTVAVLYVAKTLDFTLISLRQLTAYVPIQP